MGIGVWELIIILILVLVIFGGKRIPELGASLAKGLNNFLKEFKSSKNSKTKENSEEVEKTNKNDSLNE